MDGFRAAVAGEPDDLLGFGFAVRLTETARWLSRATLQPKAFAQLAAAPTLWLRELQVHPNHQGRGLGRSLHDRLVAGGAEEAVVLTVIPGNEPARSAYDRWGYELLGQTSHSYDSPMYDVLWLRRATWG
ncbi:GNAT family N-acetyltransferase [Ruania rhizosphaerae]|uniref:GNAT family N-acetyltransferase n=1 Tax=Ruania rhizosphaerae TaxID=1840413 RepID=UPI00135ABA76